MFPFCSIGDRALDWQAEDNDGRALARIAEMLVALAVLAECACGRSRALRRLILWILRPAEACARNFLIGEAAAGGFLIDPPAPTAAKGSVADFMRLAACLRALAHAVRKLPRRTPRLGFRSAPRCTAFRHLARCVLGAAGGQALGAPRPADTS